MPGGARLIFFVAACLIPEATPLRAIVEDAIDAREALVPVEGPLIAHGRVLGICGGVVRIELLSHDGGAVARVDAKAGSWQAGPFAEMPSGLRWGCDADGDGVVAAVDVVSASTTDVPIAGGVLLLPSR